MGTTLTGDYIGFTYNGVPSSDLGIIRTSEGSRFNENLLPITQDKTVQVPGGDGTYFFGSYHASRQMQISYAFDALTEEDFARLQRHFGDKKIHDLTFDERPYKTYMAKVTGTSSIKHIPFIDYIGDQPKRIYKGEGSVQFTAYQPYAKCIHKFLDDPYYDKIKNTLEWNNAAGLLVTKGKYDTIQIINESVRIPIYNPGDLESDFTFKIFFNQNKILAGGIIVKQNDIITNRGLNWKTFSKRNEQDVYIKINSKNNLIEGFDQYDRKTGSVYNDVILSGTFFKIPKCNQDEAYIEIKGLKNGPSWDGILPAEGPLEYYYYYY